MSVSKKVIEEECQQVVHHLDTLMRDRRAIHEEFINLSQLQKNLVIQLRSDSLSGEGKLHAFQVEKTRIEDRLEELEVQLKQKNDLVNDLDSKASEYLLNVTTESNSLYDEEEYSEQSDLNKDFVQKLVFEEMIENNEIEVATGDQNFENSYSDEAYDRNIDESIKDYDDGSPLSKHEVDDNSENEHQTSLQEACSYEYEISSATGSVPMPTELQNECPTNEQMHSLSALLSELKTVKDDLGKFIAIKNQSAIVIEDQFPSTRQELSFLRESINKMTDSLRWKDSVENIYQSNEKLDEVTESDYCDENVDDENDSIITDELLSEALQNFSRNSDESYSERVMDDDYKFSGIENLLLPSKNRSSSVASSVSTKVAMLECQLKDSNNKLVKSNKKISSLVRERNIKRSECEILQKKVQQVESKMCDLQGTFNDLDKKIASERFDLIKKLRENSAYSQILENKLKSLQLDSASETMIPDNIIQLQTELNLSYEPSEWHNLDESDFSNKDKSKALVFEKMICELQKELEAKSERENSLNSELISAKHSIREKDLEVVEMDEKIASLQQEIENVAGSFREEIKHLRQKNVQLEGDKNKLKEELGSLRNESKSFIQRHEEIDAVGGIIHDSYSVKDYTLEKLQQLMEENVSKNSNLAAIFKNLTNAYKEELNIRDATIQELQVTLENNQKQSRENYQMLEEDLATLTIQSNKEKEESTVLVDLLKEKCLKVENDFQQREQQYASAKNEIERLYSSMNTIVSDDKAVIDISEKTQEYPSSDDSYEKYARENEKVINSLQENIYSLEALIKSKTDTLEMKKGGNDSPTSSGIPLALSKFEAQLLDLKKLNDCLDSIKLALETSANASSLIKKNNDSFQCDNDSLDEVHPTLNKSEVCEDMYENQAYKHESFCDEKKNLVNEMKFKLNSISNTYSDLTFEIIISHGFDVLNNFIKNNLINRRLIKVKLLMANLPLNEVNSDLNLGDMCSKVFILEKENFILVEEKLKIIENYKQERLKTIAMENQMVSDMESLIIDLETEKKELVSSLVLAQDKMQSLSDKCITNQQQPCNPEEFECMRISVSQLNIEKNNLTSLLQQKEEEFSQKLEDLKSMHTVEMKILRNDMAEELDIVEQQKDENDSELKQKIDTLNDSWLIKLTNCENGYEMKINDENARFGRILVEKNDEYIKIVEEKLVEATGYQVRINDLQLHLEQKLNLIEELETNMEEVLVVRDNLEEKLLNKQPSASVLYPSLSKELDTSNNADTE